MDVPILCDSHMPSHSDFLDSPALDIFLCFHDVIKLQRIFDRPEILSMPAQQENGVTGTNEDDIIVHSKHTPHLSILRTAPGAF